jgi:hypothetical protein
MKNLLEWGAFLGFDNVGMRETYLKRMCNANSVEIALFFITAYDFVFRPHDRRFEGIIHLFFEANAPYAVNIYPEGRARIKTMITGASTLVREDLNHMPAEPTRGRRVGGEIGGNHKPVGLRDLGKANYNIQTMALEAIVSGADCMNFQHSVTQQLPIWKQALNNTAANTAHQTMIWNMEKAKIVKEMSDYWHTQDRRDMGLYLL